MRHLQVLLPSSIAKLVNARELARIATEAGVPDPSVEIDQRTDQLVYVACDVGSGALLQLMLGRFAASEPDDTVARQAAQSADAVARAIAYVREHTDAD